MWIHTVIRGMQFKRKTLRDFHRIGTKIWRHQGMYLFRTTFWMSTVGSRRLSSINLSTIALGSLQIWIWSAGLNLLNGLSLNNVCCFSVRIGSPRKLLISCAHLSHSILANCNLQARCKFERGWYTLPDSIERLVTRVWTSYELTNLIYNYN